MSRKLLIINEFRCSRSQKLLKQKDSSKQEVNLLHKSHKTITDAITIPIERGMVSSKEAVVELTAAIVLTIQLEAVVVAHTEVVTTIVVATIPNHNRMVMMPVNHNKVSATFSTLLKTKLKRDKQRPQMPCTPSAQETITTTNRVETTKHRDIKEEIGAESIAVEPIVVLVEPVATTASVESAVPAEATIVIVPTTTIVKVIGRKLRSKPIMTASMKMMR